MWRDECVSGSGAREENESGSEMDERVQEAMKKGAIQWRFWWVKERYWLLMLGER